MFAEIYSVAATGVILGLSAAIVSAHYKSKDALTVAENVIKHLLDKLDSKDAAPVKEAG